MDILSQKCPITSMGRQLNRVDGSHTVTHEMDRQRYLLTSKLEESTLQMSGVRLYALRYGQ